MKTSQGRHWDCEIPLSNNCGTQSTFLVPDYLIAVLESRLEFHGCTLRSYLHILLRLYRSDIMSQRIEASRRCKKRYQPPEQNLQPRHFRPQDQDWIELGMLADCLGFSRCLLFVMLLSFENDSKHESMRVADYFKAEQKRRHIKVTLRLLHSRQLHIRRLAEERAWGSSLIFPIVDIVDRLIRSG